MRTVPGRLSLKSRAQAVPLSWANKFTLARIFLVPLFIAALASYQPPNETPRRLAIAIFLIAVLTDWVDGYLARALGQRSRLGTVLDPIADKLLIWGALVGLAFLPGIPPACRVPGWVLASILIRDAGVFLGILIFFLEQGEFQVQPSFVGKMACALQMVSILGLLLLWPGAELILAVAANLTILSGVAYFVAGIRSAVPASQAGLLRTPPAQARSFDQIKP